MPPAPVLEDESANDRAERGADGTPYAVVNDGSRFVLVRAGADLRARDGQVVTFDRVRDGQWRARDPDIDRGR